MARTKIDVITCDRCARRLEEGDVRTIEFSILYHDPNIAAKLDEMEGAIDAALAPAFASATTQPEPAPPPTRYAEVCARCDKLLRRLAEQAATPSKPGRPRKEEKEDVS